jgi:hypothetical protein
MSISTFSPSFPLLNPIILLGVTPGNFNYRHHGWCTGESHVWQESRFGSYGAWIEDAGRGFGVVGYVESILSLDGVNATESDCLIATLGYKQELRRHYSTIQIFAVAFSIMGLLPSIASTLSFSMPAGPVGMVWVSDIHSINQFDWLLTDH